MGTARPKKAKSSSNKATKPAGIELVDEMLQSTEVQSMLKTRHVEGAKTDNRRSQAWGSKQIHTGVPFDSLRNKKGNYLCGRVTSVPAFGRSQGTAVKVGAFLRANAAKMQKGMHTLPSGLPLVPAKYDGESIDPGGSLTAAKSRAVAITPEDVLALARVAAHAMTMPEAPVKALRSLVRDLCADHLAVEELVEEAQKALAGDGGEPIDGKSYPGILVFASAPAKK